MRGRAPHRMTIGKVITGGTGMGRSGSWRIVSQRNFGLGGPKIKIEIREIFGKKERRTISVVDKVINVSLHYVRNKVLTKVL